MPSISVRSTRRSSRSTSARTPRRCSPSRCRSSRTSDWSDAELSLHLASATAPGWAEGVVAHMDVVLVDHAHCEKKAASTALGLIFRYPDKSALLAPLSQLAREELTHFE